MSKSSTNWRAQLGFGIYIHWPFCAAKCPYCDFNSHVSRQIDPQIWLDKYQTALTAYGSEFGERVVNTIYFGGGTPSLMPPFLVDGILQSIQRNFRLANDIEITLEANPTSIEAANFEGYAKAGVNRVSVGFQALDDNDLQRLGRNHNTHESLRAWEIACQNFARTSFDLIYARQNQSLEAWQDELAYAMTLQNGHMSLYQLTIEQGTGFGTRHAKGKLHGLPDEDLGADMYEITQEMTRSAGIPAYEISNHSAPDLESRHNQIYWDGGDYIGVGPGAHGRLSIDGIRHATETPLAPKVWLDRVSDNATGEKDRTQLTQADMLNEYLMMSLRTTRGAEREALDSLGFSAWDRIPELVEIGVMDQDKNGLRATHEGRPILNEILRRLLT